MDNTEKSLKTQPQLSAQHSDQGAACPSLILSESKKFENCSAQEVASVALILLSNLAKNVGSSDTLYLAFHASLQDIKKIIKDDVKAEYMFSMFVEIVDESRKCNPLVRGGFFE